MKFLNKEGNESFYLIDNEKPKRSDISSGFFFEKECMSTLITETGRAIPVTILRYIDADVLSVDSNIKKAIVFVKMRGKINQPVAGILKKHGKLNDLRFKDMISDSNQNDGSNESLISKQTGKIKTVDLYSDEIITLNFDEFDLGDMVDVSSDNSKGKGFTGRIKRWGHNRRPASHGSSLDHRSGGSTGGFQNRSKTKPGVHGAGHMGCVKVTMQNLQVVAKYINENTKYLCIHGSVPGPNKGLVYVRRAIKYENRC
jgi:large subunit ribosomal protein L3